VTSKMKMFILLTSLILLALMNWALSSPAIQITVYTAKPLYNIEENIYVYGEVNADGIPLENATVGLEVRDPTSSPVIIRTLTTNSQGKYDLNFKLDSQAVLGTYTANVSCSYLGEKATNLTSFSVGKASSFILTLYMGRSAYKLEEPIEIYGNATLANVPIVKALVAVEVQDPKSTPVLIRVLETDTSGLYTLTFQLPTGSPIGTYRAYASASYENQKVTANATFEVRQTISADINGDGHVNLLDIYLMAKAWGSYPGHPRWDPRCDLDMNGVINLLDVILVAREYGT